MTRLSSAADGDAAAGTIPLQFTLNGAAVSVDAAPGERLTETLRSRLGLTGTKVGCDAGDCGACSILLDGQVVCACMVPAARAQDATIVTVEGLRERDSGRRLQQAFGDHGAAQCGICTPGMLVAAAAYVEAGGSDEESAIADALGGVLCRCTGYRKIISAVAAVAGDEASREPAGTATVGDPAHVVGTSPTRIDGRRKIDGSDRFGADVEPSETRLLRVLRSPFHRALVDVGDVAAFVAATPGIELVLTARDIPGENRFGVIPQFRDQPVFAERETRFLGEAVAAVVGSPAAVTALDLETLPIHFAELPPLLGIEAALAADVTTLHDERPGNVLTRGLVERGILDDGFAAAAAQVSGHITTAFVEHAYIEPEAGYACRTGDRIEVWGCTQAPHMDREELARVLGLEETAIRILPSAVGGGFGSKLDLSFQPLVALAAWRLNAPVAIRYSRPESMQATTKRHASRIDVRIGVDADGRLTAMDFRGEFDTGAYASWGPTVANRVPVHASGPYAVPAYRARSRAVLTSTAPAGAFRGFGVPQSAIAVETLLDELAVELGIDALEFRRRNALRDGQPTVTGQVFEQGVGIGACLDALKPHWQQLTAARARFNAGDCGPLRRGIGVASCWYGCGNTSLPNPSRMRVGITRSGRARVYQGAVDIGQGADTVMTQICAAALGLPLADFELVGADTDRTPDAGKTSASRQTFVSGNAARLAGTALREHICAQAGRDPQARFEITATTLRVADDGGTTTIDLARLPADDEGLVFTAEGYFDPPTTPLDAHGQGEPYAIYGYGAQIALVEVDTALGTVRVCRVVAAHDVGQAINPQLAEGQIEGGIAQGIGMALMEAFVPGRTDNLHDYLIPTVGDVPPVDIILVEDPDPIGPYGAKGLGEHVLIPTAPAILNAIRDACGARVRDLPATPDRVLAAIRARP